MLTHEPCAICSPLHPDLVKFRHISCSMCELSGAEDTSIVWTEDKSYTDRSVLAREVAIGGTMCNIGICVINILTC